MSKKKAKQNVIITSTIETTLPISYLEPLQGNLKTLTEVAYEKLKRSIIKHGFAFPFFIWESPEDGKTYIIDGHARRETLLRMRDDGYIIPQVPVILIEAVDLNDAKQKLAVAASQYNEWNPEGIKEFFKDFEVPEIHIPHINFEMPPQENTQTVVVDAHTRTLGGPVHVEGEDDIPEVKGANINQGDIFELGDHRLMCGDSTKKSMVQALIAGCSIDMIHTDPPYGINEKAGDRSSRGMAAKTNHHLPEFNDDTIDYAVKAFEICSQLDIRKQIWWGANYYAHSLPQSASWLVWDKRVEDKLNDNNSDCELAWYLSNRSSVRIFRHVWKGMIKGSEHGERRVHPTQKPVALAEWCFDFMGDVKRVLDLFGGSGSTLIACEKTDRSCFMMEFEPHYVATIIERWQNFSGKTAYRINADGSKTDYAKLVGIKVRKK